MALSVIAGCDGVHAAHARPSSVGEMGSVSGTSQNVVDAVVIDGTLAERRCRQGGQSVEKGRHAVVV